MAAEQEHHVVVGKSREGLFDCVGVGGLGIVEVAHAGDPAAGLHAVLERLKGREPLAHASCIGTGRESSRGGAERVDDVVMPADVQFIGTYKLDLLAREADHEHAVAHEGGIVGAGIGERHAADAAANAFDNVHDLGDTRILGIDDGDIVCTHVRKELGLGEGVVAVAAVPCKMVGRDVEQDADMRMKLGCGGKLIARELGHEPLPRRARVDARDRRLTDVADGRGGHARCAQQMIGERRRGGLAVGAGDTDPALGRKAERELGLTHDLGRMRATGRKEVGELGDAGARDADIVGALDLFGTEDEGHALALESAGRLGRSRRGATHDRDALHALAEVSARPADDVETGFAQTQNEQAECLRKRHVRITIPTGRTWRGRARRTRRR